MTMCDVRRCPTEEIKPLFEKMTKKKPCKVSWDGGDGDDARLEFKQGNYKYRITVRGWSWAFFEFYTGVDNIRFDGRFEDSDMINKLKTYAEKGLGKKVSDYIDLK